MENCIDGQGRKRLVTGYVLYATLMVVLSVFITPAFQSPDEPPHFLRAVQLAQGQIVGIKEGALSGGFVPASVPRVLGLYDDLPAHPERRASLSATLEARRIPWGTGQKAQGFPNTVIYGPACYLPQVGAILVGRSLGLSVLDTFFLVRLINGLCYVAMTALALVLCRRGRWILLSIFCLPMPLFLAASVSQDGCVIWLSALIAALLTTYCSQKRWSIAIWLAFGVGFGVLGMAKPPLLVLAAIPSLLVVRRDMFRASLCLLVAAVLTFVWLGVGVTPIKVQLLAEQGVSDQGQMQYLFGHALGVPGLLARSLLTSGAAYAGGFIGNLGWLDTRLPMFYYFLTALFLVFMILTEYAVYTDRQWVRANILECIRAVGLVALLLLATLGVLISLYIVWTPVGNDVITGVQGRYFLPMAPFIVLILPNMTCLVANSRLLFLGKVKRLVFIYWIPLTVIVYFYTLFSRYWEV